MRIAGKEITTIVSDFDGTIIKHGNLVPTKRFYELADECLQKDIFFVAASGRQYRNLHKLLSGLCKDIAYIAENGSLVMYRDEVVYKAVIEEALAKELLADLMQEEGNMLVSGQYTTYMLDKNPEFVRHLAEDVGNDITVVKSFDEVKEPMIKISLSVDKEIPEELAKRYHEKYDGRFQVVDAGNAWFDFNPLESSKGKALLVLAEKLGIDMSKTVVFGDGENDIAMLKEGTVSFAMESAKANVKAHANYICDCVEDVIRYGLDQTDVLKEYATKLAISAGKSVEEAMKFWKTLCDDAEIMEEFEYFYTNRNFLCKYKIAGYTIVDILVWQVDHFKAYLDRAAAVNRYDQDKLVYSAFEALLDMRKRTKFYTDKLEGETGTDYENKY